MKTIINYCTSGLGNRLRSLASCAVISELSERKLKIYWDNITPNGCLARFDELFENTIENISLEDLEKLDSCTICSEPYDANREYEKFGRIALKRLVDKFGGIGKDGFNFSINSDNVIIFNNGFLSAVDREKSYQFIQSLIPIQEIREKIDKYTTELNLSKNLIGIHARGTDFGVGVEYYINGINNFLKENPDSKFFLSTEDPIFEKIITETFPEKIVIRKKNNYISKINESEPWQNHNNFAITKEHAQEAVEDIFLLSKTNIQIYHPGSTFCEIAKIISQKN